MEPSTTHNQPRNYPPPLDTPHRGTPRQSHSNVTVTVDPGTGRATVPSMPGRGPTTRAGKHV
ncbi:hypothetical protein BKH30_11595 [Actinomyces oris]|uniref:Uncharacterized protein n=1 Tax=Actinomyces oris TaxID=544580 RepID=A0A1Q8VIM2_9ACTO|nr:hypothetical protein BKH30_11595 [Actinomyces oris]